MSMKMSVAAVDMFEIEKVSSNEAANKPKFKVVTTNDLANPFTFDDEIELKRPRITEKQKNLIFAVTMAVVFTISLLAFIQDSIHTSRVHELIQASPVEQVVVMPGDTLWNIANQYCHNKMDLHEFVYYVSEINNLHDATLINGQVLNVPSL